MAEYLDEIPAAKVVSLRDIYRVIAGHSYYHGDGILAALTRTSWKRSGQSQAQNHTTQMQ